MSFLALNLVFLCFGIEFQLGGEKPKWWLECSRLVLCFQLGDYKRLNVGFEARFGYRWLDRVDLVF